MGPTMQMTATPRRNAGQEIAQWAWAGDVGAAVGCWRCDLSEYCHVICHGSARATTAGCWLAGSAPSKSSAQVDGAAPPPAMMISPGWAGSRGRDRDRKSARRRRELVASVHARSCMSCRRGGVPSGCPAGSAAAIAPTSRVQFFCALRCASRDGAKFPSNSLLLSEAAIAPASLPVLFARYLSSPL
jgi:hypothetical protein